MMEQNLRGEIAGKDFLRCKRPYLQGLPLVVQVQVRMPEKSVHEIDRWVAEGRFASRSDAIKTIVAMHRERERTREFYKLLLDRSREAGEKPEILLSLEEVS
jgi:Arc/MetJ-type ribon-helix-helix transcriptional regulator